MKTKKQLEKELEVLTNAIAFLQQECDNLECKIVSDNMDTPRPTQRYDTPWLDPYANMPRQRNKDEEKIVKKRSQLSQLYSDKGVLKRTISQFDFEVAAKAFEAKWNAHVVRPGEYIQYESSRGWENYGKQIEQGDL